MWRVSRSPGARATSLPRRALRTSPRTLQRRLASEGTSFQGVVDALRRELSEEYLARGLSIPEISTLLGYADSTALLVGVVWAAWHLGYAVGPTGELVPDEIVSGFVTLPLYSVLVAWTAARAGGGLGVALAFHAGGHLDHLERAPNISIGLHACHVLVLACAAALAARDLSVASRT